VVGRDFPRDLKDSHCGPLIREMAVACEDNLRTVGRLWLDSVLNGITPDPKADKETILSIPRPLPYPDIHLHGTARCAGCEWNRHKPLHQALNALYDQSESHADLADVFVEQLTTPKRKAVASTRRRQIPDQIHLPFELNRPREGAEVVTFSLFRKQ